MKTQIYLFVLALFFTYGCNTSNVNKNNKLKVEQAVSDWIKLNSDYPDSYLSQTFSNFSEVDFSIELSEPQKYFRITHAYKLMSSDKRILENKHFFVIDDKMRVGIISKKETSLLQSVPPSVFDWAISFGEKFRNIDFGGLDSAYYFKKYSDYKSIGACFRSDFYYMDNDCFTQLIKSIRPEKSGGPQLKRIILAVPDFNTEYESLGENLNELGKDMFKTFGLNHQTNIAVIQLENDTNENYAMMRFDRPKNTFEFIGFNSKDTFYFQVDTAYLNTKCFKHVLRYNN